MSQQPTLFHITHWKAGSQWVAEVLRDCAPDRFVNATVQSGHFLDKPIELGQIYPSIYLPRVFLTWYLTAILNRIWRLSGVRAFGTELGD